MIPSSMTCLGRQIAGAALLAAGNALSGPAWSQAMDVELFTRLTHKILKVEASNTDGSVSIGTGVLVGDGFVATNCHVTSRARSIELVRGEFRWEVESQLADVEHDLCVMRAPHSGDLAPAEVATTPPQVGQAVHAIGFIFGIAPRINVGEISALHRYDGSTVIQSTTPFTSGASGGGLFDDRGRLIGIVTFRYRAGAAFHFSLPVDWVLDAVKNFNGRPVSPLTGTPFWGKPRGQQPHFLRAATYAAEQDWNGMANTASEWTRLVPDSADAWRTLGIAQARMNRAEIAIESLKRAVSLDRGDGPAWYELGMAQMSIGDRAAAELAKDELHQLGSRLATALNAALGCDRQAMRVC